MFVHLLTNLFPPDVLGGYELLARDVALALQEQGHRVRVLTSGLDQRDALVSRTLRLSRPFGSEARRDRLRHLAVASWNRRAVERSLALDGRPDAVLVMSLRRLGLEPLRVYQEARIPSVLTVNDDWPAAYAPAPSLPGRFLDRLVGDIHTWAGVRPGPVVYLSEAIRRHVLAARAPLQQGRIQPQGVSLRLFERRPLRPVPPEPTLLFVGRLHPSKAPEVALDAVAALARRGVRARLLVAGAAVSVSYRDELRSRVEKAGIQGQVEWLGQLPREALVPLYQRSDVFLFPSAFEGEGQGLTYMEAMACGVPVVAYPRGGARELLEGRGVAELAASCDGEAFAAGILALRGDPGRTRRLVEAALRLVETTSLENYARVLAEELEAARGEPRGAGQGARAGATPASAPLPAGS